MVAAAEDLDQQVQVEVAVAASSETAVAVAATEHGMDRGTMVVLVRAVIQAEVQTRMVVLAMVMQHQPAAAAAPVDGTQVHLVYQLVAAWVSLVKEPVAVPLAINFLADLVGQVANKVAAARVRDRVDLKQSMVEDSVVVVVDLVPATAAAGAVKELCVSFGVLVEHFRLVMLLKWLQDQLQ